VLGLCSWDVVISVLRYIGVLDSDKTETIRNKSLFASMLTMNLDSYEPQLSPEICVTSFYLL
jgi:hypothetical protein